jgi:hypothetical protein
MTHASLLTAAALAFGVGVVHSWLGERWLIGPLLAPGRRQGMLEKSEFARRALRFAWHLTTIAWWGPAAMLVWLARAPLDSTGRAMLTITAVMFLITSIVTLAVSRGRHLAWPVFMAIAGLSIVPVL